MAVGYPWVAELRERRRGRLSAGLVMPRARRRSRSCWTMSSRSTFDASGHRTISCAVRKQPAQSPPGRSRRQTPTHGEGMSGRFAIAAAASTRAWR